MKKRLSFLLAVGMIIASAFPGVANATTIDDLEQAASEENETGFSIYGKTGLGMAEGVEVDAWFTGFATKADSGKPDIAIAVIAEEAGTGGKIAAPIAKQVFDAYYAQ